MDGLPPPDANDTAEITIEIEGGNNSTQWATAFANFKTAVRAAINALEGVAPGPPGKKIRTGGALKKKRT
jgi:hypothetical protein